ncbi:hypothetical protein JTB14_030384 [Gonioctena quinquepunctata]|nr:hypothetical protein JTB14_030384 [Gonioctena quinquepunctata]
MGGSSSKTRKLTVENDDPSNVIKVSEDVVDRIRGNQMVRQDSQRNQGLQPPPQGTPIMTTPYFLNEPSLTTLQLRQQNVAELKKNDEYWENRIKALEASHKKMNEVMEQEYTKAVEEFSGSKKVVTGRILPPCKDSERAVMECYKCYPDEPMRCAKIVQAFQECVDMKRSCLLANRG